jgi:hemolysin activation/secretion protein
MYLNKISLPALSCALTFTCLLLVNGIALAVPPPDAGQVLQNAQVGQPQLPPSSLPGMTITGQPGSSPIDHSGPKILVTGFQIAGDTGIESGVLTKITRPYDGKQLTLGEIRGVADSISRYLRSRGFMVARAYVPAQQVAGGVVTINVVIGRFGAIQLQNQSALNTDYLKSIVGPLHTGDIIRQYTLERVLLLLTDVGGVRINSTLSAGTAPGTSDLTIAVSNAQKITGEVSTDNWGDKYTGKYRGSILLGINDLLGVGDKLTLGDMYAGGGLNDYQIGYSLPTGPKGGVLSFNYARLHYDLGQSFSSIGATGLADVSGASETYPFIRSRYFSLSGVAGVDVKILRDNISSIDNDSQKRDGMVDIGVSGNQKERDGSGYTTFDLTITQGALSLESADAAANDTLGTAGSWSKSTLNAVREKYIANRVSYYASFNGQLAGKNLDSSEQLILGGATGVRAYPQGEASGDQGYVATGELHLDLPTPTFQLAGFFDYGSINLDKHPLTTTGNTVSLGGAGLGIIARPAGGYYMRVDYAFKTTGYKAISDSNENGRLWFRLAKDF